MGLNRRLSKEDIQIANKLMKKKKCSLSLNIREMEIKTRVKSHFTLIDNHCPEERIQNTEQRRVDEDVERVEPLRTANGKVK